jgi:hypothetical protein
VVLEVPIGQRLILRGTEHYAITTLEATEADPGREYYFNLGRFTRNDYGASAQYEVGPRLMANAAAGINHVDFSEDSGFFSYEQRRFSTGLEFFVTDLVRFRLGYDREHTPPSDERPLIESTSNRIAMRLSGELGALLQSEIDVGYMTKRAPRDANERFDGLTFGLRLAKDFSRGARLALDAGRATHVSGFEQNAFYLSNSLSTTLDLRLPREFTARGGLGYRRNTYLDSSAFIGRPRRDNIFSWTIGLARPVTNWSYIRVDYTREERDSNIDGLDSWSRTLLLQLGLTPFAGGGR